MNRDEIRRRRSLVNVQAKKRRIGGPTVLVHRVELLCSSPDSAAAAVRREAVSALCSMSH
jgi:hypothetical protein